jgi:hypothetical protein
MTTVDNEDSVSQGWLLGCALEAFLVGGKNVGKKEVEGEIYVTVPGGRRIS